MTEEIINADGSRNWQANILLDNIKRLEQERDELKRACNKCKLFDIEKTNRDLLERIDKLKQENKELKEEIESQKGLITVGGKQQYKYLQEIDKLQQENKELKIWLESKEKQLKHLIEYNQNKKDQIKTLRFMLFDEKEIPKDKFTMMYRIAQNERRTRSHRDLCTNITKKYRSALEEIREYCDRIEQGSVIGTQDCLINSIKNITNEVLE